MLEGFSNLEMLEISTYDHANYDFSDFSLKFKKLRKVKIINMDLSDIQKENYPCPISFEIFESWCYS